MIGLPLVSISCLTYNHAQYLRECFDGILMQKTNFDFEVVVHDDASTDETKAIIEEYTQKHPDIFFPMYQEENQYSKGVRGVMGKFNFPRCRGKYIAMCEGDDYWTDENKLQKQVDFLENNPDYSICWTNYVELDNTKNNKIFKTPDWNNSIDATQNHSFDLNSIFTPYCTFTLTTLLRKSALDMSLLLSLKNAKDNTYYSICLTKGKGMLLNFKSAVYRVHDGGVYSKVSIFKQRYYSYLNMKEIIEKIPGCDNQNFRLIRDTLFFKSIKYFPSQFDREYWHLIMDSYKIYGVKKTLKFIKSRYK